VPDRSWIAKILNALPTRWLRERKGRLRAFAFQMKHNPALRGGRAIDRPKGPRPLQRRNLTLSRAGSFPNEQGMSTLAWSGVGVGSNPEALSGALCWAAWEHHVGRLRQSANSRPEGAVADRFN